MVRLILLLLFLGNLFSQHESHSPSDAHGHSASWLNDWLLPDPGLFLWTLVTFFLVLLILKIKAWGPLMDALDEREKRIEQALLSAEKAKDEADKVSKEYDEIMKKAQSEAQDILAKSKEAGVKLKDEIEKKAKEKSDEMLDKTKKEIDSEKARAINEIKSATVDLAIKVASKVINKNLDDSANRDLAKSTIDEVN